MKINILLLLLIAMPLSSGFQETLGVFEQDQEVRLIQTCSICNYVTIDTIKLPNSTLLIVNQNMTKSGKTFYYDFSSTDLLGEYIYNTYWENLSAPVNFEVTVTGKRLSTSESIIYIILSTGVFLTLLLTLWGSIALPFKNSRGDEGRIISISSLKYFKMGLMTLSFALAVWLSNLIFTLSNNLVTLTQYKGFFEMVFVILRAFIWPVLVITIIAFFVVGANDLKLNKLLSRGIRPRG